MRGFKTKKKSASRLSHDFSQAINVKDIPLTEINYGDLEQGELEFPIGLYLPNSQTSAVLEADADAEESLSAYEKLVDFEFNDSIRDGRHEYELQKSENVARNDIAKHELKVARFLGETLASVGDYEIPQLLERFNCSKTDLFKRMWAGDIITLILAAREKIQGNRLYNLVTKCECPKAKVLKDDPKNGIPFHDLEQIKITFLESDSFPLFLAELPDGFDDGESLIKKLYFNPLRLNQIAKISERKQGITDKAAIFMQMCVGIPDSNIYGKARGSILTPDVVNLMTKSDRRFLEAAAGKINFGPEPSIKNSCPLCPNSPETEVNLNWLIRTEDFLYGTGTDSLVDL